VAADRDQIAGLELRPLEDALAVDVCAGFRAEVRRDEVIARLRDAQCSGLASSRPSRWCSPHARRG
jgi:hypothetical protein